MVRTSPPAAAEHARAVPNTPLCCRRRVRQDQFCTVCRTEARASPDLPEARPSITSLATFPSSPVQKVSPSSPPRAAFAASAHAHHAVYADCAHDVHAAPKRNPTRSWCTPLQSTTQLLQSPMPPPPHPPHSPLHPTPLHPDPPRCTHPMQLCSPPGSRPLPSAAVALASILRPGAAISGIVCGIRASSI